MGTLSQDQLLALRDALGPFKALVAQNRTDEVAAEFNKPSSPAVVVWRSQITMRDAVLVPGFDWTAIRDMPEANYRILSQLTQVGVIHPNYANVRAAITLCFGEGSGMERLLLGACKRQASKIEAMFTTGTGSVDDPAQLTFEGPLTEAEVIKALGL